MIELKYRCDGCSKQMEEAEAQASQELAKAIAEELLKEKRDFSHIWNQAGPVNHFCSVCQISAPDYWQEYVEFYSALFQEMQTRAVRQRKSFFETRKQRKPQVKPIQSEVVQ